MHATDRAIVAQRVERRVQVEVQIGERIVGLNVPTQLTAELAKAEGLASRLVLPDRVLRS